MKKPIQQRCRLVRKHLVKCWVGVWHYEAAFQVEVAYNTFYVCGGKGTGLTEEAARNDAKRIAYGSAWERWQKAQAVKRFDAPGLR